MLLSAFVISLAMITPGYVYCIEDPLETDKLSITSELSTERCVTITPNLAMKINSCRVCENLGYTKTSTPRSTPAETTITSSPSTTLSSTPTETTLTSPTTSSSTPAETTITSSPSTTLSSTPTERTLTSPTTSS
ncbi:uncharacterized protein LOC131850559 [Achroia grisella]|uniref:uncharacterized protein LOC131850559 n=1 Tax=Achroia grisella TaxID=688607 RepID=UPI0027D2CB31|nr:uncharacterized protein LOC131850559 [Achroia grisella]XP_059056827.1 uncharacterized protein LOC131850559 [Achroia grisella]